MTENLGGNPEIVQGQPAEVSENQSGAAPRKFSRREFVRFVGLGGLGLSLTGLGIKPESVYAATPEPTATPTVEPTGEVKVEKICKWENLAGCKISLDDIESGRMLEMDKVIVKQLGMESFPPEAMAVGDQFTTKHTGFQEHVWYDSNKSAYSEFIANPQKRPYRYIPSYSELMIPEIKGTKFGVFTQQWKNPGGEIKYLHYAINEHIPSNVKKWLFHDMHFGFPSLLLNNSGSQAIEDSWNKVFHNETTRNMLYEWVKTGEIPNELQSRILLPIVFDPQME